MLKTGGIHLASHNDSITEKFKNIDTTKINMDANGYSNIKECSIKNY